MARTGEQQSPVYDTKSVHVTLDLIGLLLKTEGRLSLAGFSKSLGSVSPNKVFRTLATLETRNFISRNSRGEYQLGAEAFNLARGILSSKLTHDAFLPVMQQIASQSNEAMYLGSFSKGDVVLRDMVAGRQPVQVACCSGCSFTPTNEVGGYEQGGNSGTMRLFVDTDSVKPDVTALTALLETGKGTPAIALVMLVPNFRLVGEKKEQLLQILSRTIAARAGELPPSAPHITADRPSTTHDKSDTPLPPSRTPRIIRKPSCSSSSSQPYRKAEVHHGSARI